MPPNNISGVASVYPVLLDPSGKLIVVVGGGNVAARKVRGLLDAGADRICVVAPAVDRSIEETGVRIIRERYDRRHIAGATLVFAATNDPCVNAAVVADARSAGALVNRADDHEDGESDFSTPAVHRDGPIVLALSAGGSPALAARLRDVCAAAIAPAWITMAQAMAELRPLIRGRRELAPERRREIFLWLASDEALQLLQEQGIDAVRLHVMQSLDGTRD